MDILNECYCAGVRLDSGLIEDGVAAGVEVRRHLEWLHAPEGEQLVVGYPGGIVCQEGAIVFRPGFLKSCGRWIDCYSNYFAFFSELSPIQNGLRAATNGTAVNYDLWRSNALVDFGVHEGREWEVGVSSSDERLNSILVGLPMVIGGSSQPC